jgi:hypothetical protein
MRVKRLLGTNEGTRWGDDPQPATPKLRRVLKEAVMTGQIARVNVVFYSSLQKSRFYVATSCDRELE